MAFFIALMLTLLFFWFTETLTSFIRKYSAALEREGIMYYGIFHRYVKEWDAELVYDYIKLLHKIR